MSPLRNLGVRDVCWQCSSVGHTALESSSSDVVVVVAVASLDVLSVRRLRPAPSGRRPPRARRAPIAAAVPASPPSA
eukprot:CAMPEP_0181134956 /NCGR_PEP_ID=MMETSP1071-20121207/32366_1 /TAXON_ID=35127 /ORGANISM="Thalassiosira sp., Strain NH16" /LENGTH=76 /DNA_ID=CAMNT_0023221513 /DNA_START=453 /DNA_END=679 /DNA_ORIENTATION=-